LTNAVRAYINAFAMPIGPSTDAFGKRRGSEKFRDGIPVRSDVISRGIIMRREEKFVKRFKRMRLSFGIRDITRKPGAIIVLKNAHL